MIDLHSDDIPVLTNDQMKMSNLIICFRGYTFHYNYGYLVLVEPN